MYLRTLGLLILTILIGCGNDASKGRIIDNDPTRTTPGATPDATGINSYIFRSKNTDIISAGSEITQILNNTLPANYRTIPSMETDDEKSATIVTTLGRPNVVCGDTTTATTINTRITDCGAKNGTLAVWDARANGTSGEGNWLLVKVTTDQKEIWLDTRTGLVWSDVVTSGNWCQASGNIQSPTPSATIDCNTLSSGISVCANLDTLNGNIKWRLPTRNDYLQADLDGARAVLKPVPTGLWTATMESGVQGRTNAWVYELSSGTLSGQKVDNVLDIRCVGAPVR